MDITFLHWGLHPWAIYTMVGLAPAFFSFNKGLPLSIRSVFYPVLGEKIHGFAVNIIDILATVATLFGVQQVNAGLDHLFGIGQSSTIQVVLITGITALATWSVLAGLSAGIRRLSEINLVLAGLLCLFVLLVGPSLFIIKAFGESGPLPSVSSRSRHLERDLRGYNLAARLDGFLLGLVDSLVSLCGNVHCQSILRQNDPGVHPRSSVRPHPDNLRLADHLRQQRPERGYPRCRRYCQSGAGEHTGGDLQTTGELPLQYRHLRFNRCGYCYLFRDLLGFRVHGDRHYYGRRQPGSSEAATPFLGPPRRCCRGRAAPGRRPGRLAARRHYHGASLCPGAAFYDIQPAKRSLHLYRRSRILHASL